MNLFPAIAEKIERDPGLLDQAVQTVQHWRRHQFAPVARLDAWESLLRDAAMSPSGLTRLLHLLREESEAARQMKAYAPLGGLLSREERRKLAAACTYDH